MQRFWGDKVNN